jgi:hypothetical protein
MKNHKSKPKFRLIKELAEHFEQDLKKTLPIVIRQDGSVVYKNYYVKLMPLGDYGLYELSSDNLIQQYYLKTCAMLAAKAHHLLDLSKFYEIKRLDTAYWANYCDNLIFKNNIKLAKDQDRYIILLNKLEHSEQLTGQYKAEISAMFKRSFV